MSELSPWIVFLKQFLTKLGADDFPTSLALLDGESRVVFANRFMRDWMEKMPGGHSEDQASRFIDLIPTAHRSLLEPALAEATSSGRFAFVENLVIPMGGEDLFFNFSIFPVAEMDGGIVGAVVALEDITRYTQLKRAYVEASDYLNLLIDSLNDGFYAMDANNAFSFCNPRMLEMLKMDEGQFLSSNSYDIVDPGEFPTHRRDAQAPARWREGGLRGLPQTLRRQRLPGRGLLRPHLQGRRVRGHRGGSP